HVGGKYLAGHAARSLGALRLIRSRWYFPFRFPQEFPSCFLQSRGRVSEGTSCALVGLLLLCRFWSGGDELRSDRWRVARLQLFNRSGGLRNQSGTAHCESLAHRLAHRPSRWHRWIISFLLVGLTFGCSNRLHIRGSVDFDCIYWPVAPSHEIDSA